MVRIAALRRVAPPRDVLLRMRGFHHGLMSASLIVLIYLSLVARDESSQAVPKDHGLRAIVTGIEHSGTTVMGYLLYNAPCVIGAFETGYLLAKNPTEIHNVHPWFQWNCAETNTRDLNYRLTPGDREVMKGAPNFLSMYGILRQRSYLFNELVDELNCTKPYQMIDKTPHYVYPENFRRVLSNTPGVPVIVMQKDFDKLVESWAKRNQTMTRQRYDATYNNVQKVKRRFPDRILVVQEEELMAQPNAVLQDVFAHVGLEWKEEYLEMKGLLRKVSNDPDLTKRIEKWQFGAGKHSPSLLGMQQTLMLDN